MTILANPFTRQVINTDVPNPHGCNQHTGPDCKGGLKEAVLKSRDISKVNKAAASGDYYQDPSTGKLKKTREKAVGYDSMSRQQLLRFAGDELGIETDDMGEINTEDTESVRDYVKKYAKTYAGLRVT